MIRFLMRHIVGASGAETMRDLFFPAVVAQCNIANVAKGATLAEPLTPGAGFPRDSSRSSITVSSKGVRRPLSRWTASTGFAWIACIGTRNLQTGGTALNGLGSGFSGCHNKLFLEKLTLRIEKLAENVKQSNFTYC